MLNFQILKIWIGTRALLRICAVWLILFVSAGSASAESQGSKFSSDEENNMQSWLDLSFEYRFSRLDSAFYYADLVLNRAREKKDLFFEAEALRSQATNYQAQGDFDKALELAFEALRLARHLGDSIKIAHTQNLIGMTYDQQGNFPGALAQYREAYGIYKSKNEEEWLAMIAVNLGILFKAQGAYEQVVPYYREA